MLDPAIQTFLSERKAAWLKDKIKSCKNEAEEKEVEYTANEKFSLVNWLPDAAKRAGQLFMVSHPGKFSHPSAKTSSVIANAERKTDGFLRTGNVQAEFDVFGNAAALDVFKFLSLALTDGQTVLSHLEQSSDTIKQQFTLPATPFIELQQGLLAIKDSSATVKTSEKIKQVYFPVADDYHLLSLLTPSGLMFKLKERVNGIRFSEEAKQAREARRNQQQHEQGFDELYNLTVIGFGGTKPQNISVLNNQNGGTAYLLLSVPPTLQQRDVQVPKASFFSTNLYYKHYQDSFNSLHALLKTDYNNINIREGRDYWIMEIVEQVLEKVWSVRQLPSGWSEQTTLSAAQKIWLDDVYCEQRERTDDWLDEIISDFARWFSFAYERTVSKEKAVPLGNDELAHIKQVIVDNQEVLR